MVREGRTVHKFRQTMQEVREASDGALPGPGEAGGGGLATAYRSHKACFMPLNLWGCLHPETYLHAPCPVYTRL